VPYRVDGSAIGLERPPLSDRLLTRPSVFLCAVWCVVVIVMLNLLIAIVSTVYDQLQASHTHEFLRAKAELICEVEQVGADSHWTHILEDTHTKSTQQI
jgi:hypothetical protein